MSGSHIYILGSHTGTLYIGVTSNLYLRVMQHKHHQSWVQRPCPHLGMEDDYSA
jgi:predicted GIY-YIG superfamily endonuclease